jgi:hypothetical protein
VKDPTAANLDRIQIIKGWSKSGQSFEKIYDVVWSGDRTPDAFTGRVPAIESTVDLVNATYDDATGSTELIGTWSDPDFDPSLDAFYYARALAIPTPRWTTIQAKELGVAPPETVPATVQERAWSSPVWYTPTAEARSKAIAGRTTEELEKQGAVALGDEDLKKLVVGKWVWLRNTVTGGIFKTQWTKDGLLLIMNVDPRIPQPSEFGDPRTHSYLGDPNSAYSVADGKLVTNFGNRDYAYSVYQLDNSSDPKKPHYFLARSNEFGFANYQIIDTPVFLGTEVTDATVPAETVPAE